MSTTIDSLDIQIATSVGQSPQKIQELANALGELKNQGKIGAATSAMKSLAKALDVLTPSLNSLNPAKLQQLRGAMSGLANIQKASGLNSAVNTLKKIPDVINGLDTSKLDTFERQMDRLASALRPLAEQLDKIGNSFSKLPTHITKAVTATNKMASATEKAAASDKKHGEAINAKSLNIMSAIHNFHALLHVVQLVGNAISYTMAEAMEWDGIQYRFGRAFGEDAEEVYAYAQKINDVLGINMQQFMQYSSLYGSLLSGFGMAQEKVTTISVGLTELSYDIWAAYNDRFKSLEQASEAVRSAITGEIEPIRNAGIALTEASLQEYLEQIGMATVSIENLSEAQKAEVRYAAMMNAAMQQGIVGTYASEMQTAEGAVRSLTQSWKGLVQAFGSLFIPILQAVIPYLTAFVELLREAIAAVAAFFNIPFFEIDWGSGAKDMAAGVGGAAEGAKDIENGMKGAAKAAKKLRDYTMGFDELNIIKPQEDSGSGGGGSKDSGVNWGSGLDLDTMWDDSVFAKASQQVNELKQQIKDWFAEWKTEILIVSGLLGSLFLASKLSSFITALGKIGSAWKAVKGVFGGIKEFFLAAKAMAPEVGWFAALFPKLSSALTSVGTAISTAAKAVGAFVSGISAPAWAIIVGVIAGIASVVIFLKRHWEEVTKAAKDFFATNIAPKLKEIKGHWEKIKETLAPLGELFLWLIQPIKDLITGFAEWWEATKPLTVLGEIFEVVGGVIFSVVSGVIAGAFRMAISWIEGFVQTISGIVQIVSGVVKFIVKAFTGDLQGAWDALVEIGEGVFDVFSGLWKMVVTPIKEFVDGVISWFVELWDELVGHSIVPDTINGIIEWFLSLPGKILKPVQNFVNSVIDKFKNMWTSIKSWWNASVAPKLTWTYWKKQFDNMVSAIGTKLNEAWDKIKKFFSVEEWKKKVQDAIQAIKDNFKLPSFPKIKLSVIYDTNVSGVKEKVYKALGLTGWPSLNWSTYATGGWPQVGEAFIASERGPELVGRIGNRSAVANTEQIVEAVSRGVYEAVAAAMGGYGGQSDQSFNLYLDGKQIAATVEKHQKARGATLMTGGVVYGF